MRDDDEDWARPLVAGLGVLVGVALLIGAVIAVIAIGALRITGGDGGSSSAPEAEPSLYIPERTSPRPPLDAMEPDADPSAEASPDEGESATESASPSPSPTEEPPPPAPRKVISLSATPVSVSPMQDIYLTGTFPGGEGARLQVQRYEGGWVDFPTTASVSGGTFTTFVRTGRAGVNRFRVVDPDSGKASNAVSVRVG